MDPPGVPGVPTIDLDRDRVEMPGNLPPPGVVGVPRRDDARDVDIPEGVPGFEPGLDGFFGGMPVFNLVSVGCCSFGSGSDMIRIWKLSSGVSQIWDFLFKTHF